MPESKVSDFSWADYQARVNNELVAILGNWVNRVMVLTHKYFEGVVPSNENHADYDMLATANQSVENIDNLVQQFKFRDALSELMSIARLGNKYLQDTAPWHGIK